MSLGWTVLVLVIYVLACARVTRLLNGDKITDGLRKPLASRARDWDRTTAERSRWATALYYVECPWCIGFWICLGSAYLPVRLIGWPAWALIPVAFAASHLVGVFAFAADTEEIEVQEDDQ